MRFQPKRKRLNVHIYDDIVIFRHSYNGILSKSNNEERHNNDWMTLKFVARRMKWKWIILIEQKMLLSQRLIKYVGNCPKINLIPNLFIWILIFMTLVPTNASVNSTVHKYPTLNRQVFSLHFFLSDAFSLSSLIS